MKYARELMELMAPFPGRRWKMTELVNYIAGEDADERKKERVRKGARRVLGLLEDSGHIEVDAQEGRGASARYVWKASDRGLGKVGHAVVESGTESGTINPSQVAPSENAT